MVFSNGIALWKAPLRQAGRCLKYCAVSLAATLALSSSCTAAAPLVFMPVGTWTLTGNEGQCFLTHKLSNDAGSGTLRIDQFPREYGFLTTISFEHRRGEHIAVPAKIGFEPDSKMLRREPIEMFNKGDGLHRVYRTALGPDDFQKAAESGVLFILPTGKDGLQIAVPQLADAIVALRRCEQTLMETSGLPPEDIRRLRSFPEPNGNTGRQRYYQMPVEKNADLEDVAVARAIVDERGSPMNCEVIHRAKSDKLNSEACGMIMRRTFVPATDTTGKTVKAPFFAEASWVRFN